MIADIILFGCLHWDDNHGGNVGIPGGSSGDIGTTGGGGMEVTVSGHGARTWCWDMMS